MIFFTQTDKRWSNEIMTEGKDWCDRLGRYGCLVTSITNCLNFFNIKQITPKDLNDIIKTLQAYQALADKNTPEEKASILLTYRLFSYIKNFKYEEVNEYKNDDNTFYIAEITHKITNTSHFVNILNFKNNKYIIFDVENGTVYTLDKNEIKRLIRITKIA